MASPSGARTGLVCDADGIIVHWLGRMLVRMGIDIVGQAPTAREAVSLALSEKPDLILLDYELPDYDGIEAARRIMEKREACILLLTCQPNGGLAEKARAAGICGILQKPFTSYEARETLAKALAECCGAKRKSSSAPSHRDALHSSVGPSLC